MRDWIEIYEGRPVIRDTRITVSSIVGRISGGDTIEMLIEEYAYRELPREAFEAALAYAAAQPQQSRPVPPWRQGARSTRLLPKRARPSKVGRIKVPNPYTCQKPDACDCGAKQGHEVCRYWAESETDRTSQTYLSLHAAALALGFSEKHVLRLIAAGELEASVSLASLRAFERRREAACRRADEWSRELDELGAPDE